MARMTALRPGASPPPVVMAIRNRSALPNQGENLSRRGMAAQGLLGEHQPPIHPDLEHPARGLDEFDLGIRECLFELGGQTGRPRLVVSDQAVLDGNAHRLLTLR